MAELFGLGGLVEASHGKEMVHLHASRRDVCAHSTQLGVVGIQLFEFSPQSVKGGIANFGLCKVVVEVRMVSDLLRQSRNMRRI